MDKKLEKLKQDYMNTPIPAELDQIVRQSLQPRRKPKRNAAWVAGIAAVAAVFVSSVNLSPAFAQALSEIPVVGGVVKLVTFVEYQVEDEKFHADIKVPAIANLENKELESALNAKYLEENKKLYQEFMAEMEALKQQGGGHIGVDSGYEVVTDTERILSIQRYVVQTAASGVETLQYDTIDKQEQVLITLPSLFRDDRYISVISENIKEQMRKQVKEEGKIYWVNGIDLDGPVDTFQSISPTQDFYITKDGKLVISFDEYEVAPGYMGTVEFVIPTEAIADLLVSDTYIK